MAYSIVLWQAITTVVVARVSWAIAGELAALSALIGGGISTVASLAMAFLAFRNVAAADPQLAAEVESSGLDRSRRCRPGYPGPAGQAFRADQMEGAEEDGRDEQAPPDRPPDHRNLAKVSIEVRP